MCTIVAAEVPEEQAPQIINPRIGTLHNDVRNLPVHVYFPQREYLHLERDTGEFRLHVEAGQWVREGDILASLLYDNRRTPIFRDAAAMRLTQHDRNTENDALRHRSQIENARIALEFASDVDFERLFISLAQFEIEYQQFRNSSAAVRERLVEELAAYNARLDTRFAEGCDLPLFGSPRPSTVDFGQNADIYVELLTAPFDGYITFTILETVPFRNRDMFEPPSRFIEDVCILGNPPIIGITRADNFHFKVWVDHEEWTYVYFYTGTGVNNLHRQTSRFPTPNFVPIGTMMYGKILTITGTHLTGTNFVPVEAKVVSDPWAAGERQQLVYWLRPLDMEAFMANLRSFAPYYYMQVLTGAVFNTLVSIPAIDHGILLPAAAVHPEDGRHFIHVYENGEVTKRYIVVGVLQDGYFQIISGVELDTKVVIAS